MAVPGEITSALSAGSNGLLRQGAAPVTRIAGRARGAGARAAGATRQTGRLRVRLPSRPRRARRPGATTDELVRASGLDAGAVAAALVELELAGRVVGRGGRVSKYDHPMTPYWLLEDHDARSSRRRSTGRADVEIVGAGITGCACAHALAGAGLRVRVHDAREIAGGASGRNGGFALAGRAAPYDVMVDSIGQRVLRAHLALDGGRDRGARSRSQATRSGRSGAFVSRSTTRSARSSGPSTMRWSPTGSRSSGSTSRTARLAGSSPPALLHPTDGALQPARWVRRLAGLAAAAGAEIVEHHRVESLDELEAPTVVIATDGYPSGLLGDLEGLIVPTRGQVIATEPLAERLLRDAALRTSRLRLLAPGRARAPVAGGFRDVSMDSEFTAEETLTDTVQDALVRFVNELAGRELRIDHRWAGIFGLVLDFLPVVGPVPGSDRVWVAGGYSGHGNVLGFACGRLVARAIRGEHDPLLDTFAPARLLG